MEIDPRYCFDCDRRLGDPPRDDGGRLRRCPKCQAGADAHSAALGDLESMPPPRFHGAIALGVPLPDWPTAITLLALTVWDRFSELAYVEIPGSVPLPAHPRAAATSFGLGDQPPRTWLITTDIDTIHYSGGGGGGTPGTDRLLAWERDIAPTLPPDARRLHVRAQSPGTSAATIIDLTSRPLTRSAAGIDHTEPSGDADPGCASCGPPLPTPPTDPHTPPGLELDWAMPAPPEHAPDTCRRRDHRSICATCRSNREAVLAAKVPTRPQPDQVIALGAQLGALFGADLIIPTLTRWQTWFDLTIIGHRQGPWDETVSSPTRAMRWSAQDDAGHLYRGATTGGGSGLGLVRKDLTFTPALAPDATTLTLAFPSAIDGHAYRATIDLHPEAIGSSR